MRPLPLACAFATLLIAAAVPAKAQQDDDATNAIDDRPHITIIGQASTEVTPDIAEISLGVTTENPSAAAAAGENARKMQAIIDTAKAQGVAGQDIKTQSVTLSQTYDEVHDTGGRYTGRKPRGFSADNTIVLRVRALDKAGALAQSLIEKGANQFNGISFSFEHPEPVQDRLLADAMRDAKRKAQIAAAALGAKLGPVLLIERPNAGTSVPVFKSRMAPAALAAAPPLPVEAGTQTLTSDMEVTWALQP